MTSVGGLAYWQGLNESARAGELELDPSVASDIAAAADEFIAGLEAQRNTAINLGRISGVGGLDSARELAAKFEQKAVGPGGLVEHYDQMIEVLLLIKDTVSRSVKELVAEDEAIGAGLPVVEGGN